MNALLFIPWFKAEAWEIPLPGTDSTLPIQPFGVLVAIGVLLGAKIAERFGQKNGIAPSVVSDLVGHVVIIGFVACYFLNGLFYETDKFLAVLENPIRLFDFKNYYLGLSSFGGFAGAILGLFIWKKRRKLSALAVGEAAVFAFPFGWIFGRTGCFVTHDHPGKETDFFLAVDNYQCQHCSPTDWVNGEPVFPARHDLGLYEVFWSIAVCALFLYLAKKKRRRGFYMGLLPILYVPIRFPLDYLRIEDATYAGLTPGQWGALLLLAVGAAIMWYIHKYPEPEIPAHAAWPPPGGDEDKKKDKGEQGAPTKGKRPSGKSKKKRAAS